MKHIGINAKVASHVFSLLASVEGTTVCLEIPLQSPPPPGDCHLATVSPPHPGDRRALTWEFARGAGATLVVRSACFSVDQGTHPDMPLDGHSVCAVFAPSVSRCMLCSLDHPSGARRGAGSTSRCPGHGWVSQRKVFMHAHLHLVPLWESVPETSSQNRSIHIGDSRGVPSRSSGHGRGTVSQERYPQSL